MPLLSQDKSLARLADIVKVSEADLPQVAQRFLQLAHMLLTVQRVGDLCTAVALDAAGLDKTKPTFEATNEQAVLSTVEVDVQAPLDAVRYKAHGLTQVSESRRTLRSARAQAVVAQMIATRGYGTDGHDSSSDDSDSDSDCDSDSDSDGEASYTSDEYEEEDIKSSVKSSFKSSAVNNPVNDEVNGSEQDDQDQDQDQDEENRSKRPKL